MQTPELIFVPDHVLILVMNLLLVILAERNRKYCSFPLCLWYHLIIQVSYYWIKHLSVKKKKKILNLWKPSWCIFNCSPFQIAINKAYKLNLIAKRWTDNVNSVVIFYISNQYILVSLLYSWQMRLNNNNLYTNKCFCTTRF